MSLTLRATPWNSSAWSGVSALTLNRPLAASIWATKGAKFASPRAFSSALRGVRRYSGCAPGGWGIADLLNGMGDFRAAAAGPPQLVLGSARFPERAIGPGIAAVADLLS